MTAHALRPEIGSLLRAPAAEHVCVGRADGVGCRLFARLLVPFVGHVAIVADMHIPPGGKAVARLKPSRRRSARVVVDIGQVISEIPLRCVRDIFSLAFRIAEYALIHWMPSGANAARRLSIRRAMGAGRQSAITAQNGGYWSRTVDQR